MKYSLCITTPEVNAVLPFAMLRGSFIEKTVKASNYGYDGVELMTIEPLKVETSNIMDSLLSRSLEVSAVSSGAVLSTTGLSLLAEDEKTRAAARKKLSELIQFTGRTGAKIVTIGSFRGRASSVGGSSNAWRILSEVIKEASAEAESMNVNIALEPINRFDSDFLHTAEETAGFIENIGCRNLGILLDTFHMITEEASFTGCIEKTIAQGLLRHIHISDSSRMPPGKGDIDFTAIIKTLRKYSYKGYLSAELLAGDFPDDRAEETINFMRKLELLSENN